MLESLSKIDLGLVIAVIQLIIILVGLFKGLEKVEKKNRWQFILDSIPEIHGKVQKIASQTKTQKDDKFVELVDVGLKAFKLLPVQRDEIEAIKALGSGYHFEYKEQRDIPLFLGGFEPPLTELKQPGSED